MSRSLYRRSYEGYVIGIVFAAVVSALALGCSGLAAYATTHKEAQDSLDTGYKSLQILLMGGPSLNPPIPWMLHAARFLGAALELSFAFWIVLRLVPDALQMFRYRLPSRRQRVIVCGLGELAEHLAQEARRQRKRVLVVDPLCNISQRQILRQQGMVGIEGDPRLPELLGRALLHRAERLIAATESDADNLAIAGASHKWLAGVRHGRHEVPCQLLIADHALRAELNEHFRVGKHSGRCRVIVDDLNQPLAAARQALADHPLDFLPIHEGDTTVAHLIVLGTGPTAQALVLHAAHIAHFANEVEGNRRLRLTIATPEEANYRALLADHPALTSVCDLDCLVLPANRTEMIHTLTGGCCEDELITFAFALEGALNDGRNLSDALSLRNSLQKQLQAAQLKAPPQILIHQSTERGPVGFFQQLRHNASSVALHFFGMIEHCMQWDSIFHGRLDKPAEAIHKTYNKKHAAEGYPEWAELNENARNANRQAAGHIGVKLRALAVHVDSLDPRRERVTKFLPKERELLAGMEHLRWNAEKLLAGWQWGPVTDRPNKINECICAWDKLDPAEREKDFEQVDLIPEILHDIGLGIYRIPRKEA